MAGEEAVEAVERGVEEEREESTNACHRSDLVCSLLRIVMFFLFLYCLLRLLFRSSTNPTIMFFVRPVSDLLDLTQVTDENDILLPATNPADLLDLILA